VRRLVRLATWCSNNDIGFAGALAVAEAINLTLAHYFLFYDEVRRQSGDSQREREREQSRAEQSRARKRKEEVLMRQAWEEATTR
jgi:hypothetical protein